MSVTTPWRVSSVGLPEGVERGKARPREPLLPLLPLEG